MKLRLVILFAACAFPFLASAVEPCLHYAGDPVTLSGKVTERTFFGPPNYGENPKTDSREPQWVLLLEKPICVDENPSDYEEAEQNQLVVTLVPLHNTNIKKHLGKKVSVQGTLFHAQTGHHHTPVLIEVLRIE
jgi:hypothetical protein